MRAQLPRVPGIATYASVPATVKGSYAFRVKAARAGYSDSGYATNANACVATSQP